jgi:hypothetical protein
LCELSEFFFYICGGFVIKNIILRKGLVDAKKILLPPLHFKLGIMKQFVKALPKIGNCFKYLCKLKEGVFVGADIRKLIFDVDFLLAMTEVEREAWIAFKSVVTKFLGNNKDPENVNIVADMLGKSIVLGCLTLWRRNFKN